MYNYNRKSDADIKDVGKDDWMKPSGSIGKSQQLGI